jgi:hypothetical protein
VGGHRPDGVEIHETLPFDEVQKLLKSAKIVVCHGGTGSLITALREGCQLIAMPRCRSWANTMTTHQAEITEAFVQRGPDPDGNTPEGAFRGAEGGARPQDGDGDHRPARPRSVCWRT